jgi:5-dehydro-2-deoxygluconokinase
MFELLVPPEKEELEELHGNKQAYEGSNLENRRARSTRRLRARCRGARRNGRSHVSCIVLGRGEDENKVHEWLSVAPGVPGSIGFAVGRTVF